MVAHAFKPSTQEARGKWISEFEIRATEKNFQKTKANRIMALSSSVMGYFQVKPVSQHCDTLGFFLLTLGITE